METTPFFVLLFLHLIGLILGFGSVLVTDLYGLLWIRNRARFSQVVRVSGVTEWFIWAGWGLMVAAGLPLLLLKGVVDNLLIVKLFFVALIGLNGLPLHLLHRKVRGYEQGHDVPTLILFRLTLALFVSQLGWWSAVLIGFLHRHVQSVIEWPASPWGLIGGVVAGLLALWGGGEVLIRKNRAAADDVKEKLTPSEG
jgi:F0F1-type ATP synthase assembly protein I